MQMSKFRYRNWLRTGDLGLVYILRRGRRYLIDPDTFSQPADELRRFLKMGFARKELPKQSVVEKSSLEIHRGRLPSA
jgi:hypothetical protein